VARAEGRGGGRLLLARLAEFLIECHLSLRRGKSVLGGNARDARQLIIFCV
jgi:hypothetical protein